MIIRMLQQLRERGILARQDPKGPDGKGPPGQGPNGPGNAPPDRPGPPGQRPGRGPAASPSPPNPPGPPSPSPPVTSTTPPPASSPPTPPANPPATTSTTLTSTTSEIVSTTTKTPPPPPPPATSATSTPPAPPPAAPTITPPNPPATTNTSAETPPVSTLAPANPPPVSTKQPPVLMPPVTNAPLAPTLVPLPVNQPAPSLLSPSSATGTAVPTTTIPLPNNPQSAIAAPSLQPSNANPANPPAVTSGTNATPVAPTLLTSSGIVTSIGQSSGTSTQATTASTSPSSRPNDGEIGPPLAVTSTPGLSRGEKAGISLGVLSFVFMCIGLGFFLYRKRRRRIEDAEMNYRQIFDPQRDMMQAHNDVGVAVFPISPPGGAGRQVTPPVGDDRPPSFQTVESPVRRWPLGRAQVLMSHPISPDNAGNVFSVAETVPSALLSVSDYGTATIRSPPAVVAKQESPTIPWLPFRRKETVEEDSERLVGAPEPSTMTTMARRNTGEVRKLTALTPSLGKLNDWLEENRRRSKVASLHDDRSDGVESSVTLPSEIMNARPISVRELKGLLTRQSVVRDR